jgi:hypothetical protein
MAGFHLSIYGRVWVSAEGRGIMAELVDLTGRDAMRGEGREAHAVGLLGYSLEQWAEANPQWSNR